MIATSAVKDELKARLLDALGIAVVYTDRAGKISYCNRAAADLFGWQAADVTGRNFLKITRARLLPREGREPAVHDRRLIEHHDGLGLPVHMVETDLLDEDGNLIGYLSVFTGTADEGSLDKIFALEDRIDLTRHPEFSQPLKPLSGYTLSVCSSCRKILTDDQQWVDVEEYLKNQLDADLSHTTCPQCAPQVYPELFPPADPSQDE